MKTKKEYLEAKKTIVDYEKNFKRDTNFNCRNLLQRFVGAPFIFCLLLLAHIIFAVKRFGLYLKYGAELIPFNQNERPTIEKLYHQIKEDKT